MPYLNVAHTYIIEPCVIPAIIMYVYYNCKGVFKGGGGLGGLNPPPKFSDFFLKSEGKEIERKKGCWEGVNLLTYFWG